MNTSLSFKNGETWELSFKDKILAAQKVGGAELRALRPVGAGAGGVARRREFPLPDAHCVAPATALRRGVRGAKQGAREGVSGQCTAAAGWLISLPKKR